MGLFNEKDRMDGGKRMASNWEVILTPFLRDEEREKKPFCSTKDMLPAVHQRFKKATERQKEPSLPHIIFEQGRF